jgi:hypothetical protein
MLLAYAQVQSPVGFAAFEILYREQDLTGLAPKRRLISAQAIEGIGWQAGQADKGTGEIVELISRL